MSDDEKDNRITFLVHLHLQNKFQNPPPENLVAKVLFIDPSSVIHLGFIHRSFLSASPWLQICVTFRSWGVRCPPEMLERGRDSFTCELISS